MTSAEPVNDSDAGEAAEHWKIQPAAPTIVGQLQSVWRYRKLFWPLAVRALFEVYQGAVLGITWMAVQPLVVAVSAAFVIGMVFGVSVDPVPLPLFILAGLAIWTLVRRVVQWTTRSMNSGAALLQRLYIPAFLLLLTSMSPAFFQFAVVLVLTAMTAIYYGWVASVGWQLFATIPAVLMGVTLGMALGCFMSILNAFARDTWLTLRYALSVWMVASPIFYPIEVIPVDYRWIIYLNPLTPIVELFRWGLLGYGTVQWHYLGIAAAQTVVLLLAGLWFFARQQNRLFDHL